jgi:ABC-type phosphate transport system substrate-binding protein
MYTGTENLNPAIQDYLDWILTPEAQTIVTDLGFVPIKTP